MSRPVPNATCRQASTGLGVDELNTKACNKHIDEVDIVATNGAVYLRKIRTSDACFIQDLTNQKGWLEQIGDKDIHSLNDAIQFIKDGPQNTYKRYGFGLYLIVCCQHHVPLGVCGLLKRSYLNAPDLGYAISEEYYRQGYAQMSCKLVLAILHKLTNAKFLYASTTKTNYASQKLLGKLGFSQEGVLLSQDSAESLLLFKRDTV